MLICPIYCYYILSEIGVPISLTQKMRVNFKRTLYWKNNLSAVIYLSKFVSRIISLANDLVSLHALVAVSLNSCLKKMVDLKILIPKRQIFFRLYGAYLYE